MAAGPLRESITVQRRGPAVDDYGNARSGAWADVADMIGIPAQIRPLRASEQVTDEGVEGRSMFEIRMRYTATLAGIEIADRIVDARSGATFNIEAIPLNYDQRDRFLTIQASRGGADG